MLVTEWDLPLAFLFRQGCSDKAKTYLEKQKAATAEKRKVACFECWRWKEGNPPPKLPNNPHQFDEFQW